jgi:hypothetical protein
MQHLDVLLFNAFDGYKPHGRSTHGLADGFCIVGIIFVTFDVGFDKLGADQSGIMTQFYQFPCQ